MKGFRQMGKGPQSGHHFSKDFGFSGSAGISHVKPHTRSPRAKLPKFADGGIFPEKVVPKGASGSSDGGHVIGEATRPFKKGGKVSKYADGGRIILETERLPGGMSGSSDGGHIIGESTRPFKKGGKVKGSPLMQAMASKKVAKHTMPPKTPKQAAPAGAVNFADFKKGGKAKKR